MYMALAPSMEWKAECVCRICWTSLSLGLRLSCDTKGYIWMQWDLITLCLSSILRECLYASHAAAISCSWIQEHYVPVWCDNYDLSRFSISADSRKAVFNSNNKYMEAKRCGRRMSFCLGLGHLMIYSLSFAIEVEYNSISSSRHGLSAWFCRMQKLYRS